MGLVKVIEMDLNKYLCPVCKCSELEQDPDKSSFEICSSCGVEFGNDDAAPTQLEVYKIREELREAWLQQGGIIGIWYDGTITIDYFCNLINDYEQ